MTEYITLNGKVTLIMDIGLLTGKSLMLSSKQIIFIFFVGLLFDFADINEQLFVFLLNL